MWRGSIGGSKVNATLDWKGSKGERKGCIFGTVGRKYVYEEVSLVYWTHCEEEVQKEVRLVHL